MRASLSNGCVATVAMVLSMHAFAGDIYKCAGGSSVSYQSLPCAHGPELARMTAAGAASQAGDALAGMPSTAPV